jgi:sugar phosphate permease
MGTDLGISNTQLGIVGTTLYVTYGLGKFLNGVMADRSNIRRFMATGLIVSGLLNILFASTASVAAMVLVWGLNGWFQSMGFPPIARGMTLWYPPEGKATRWAFWTCSHQVGTAIIMAFTAWILTWGTWHTAFWLPGVMTIVVGVGLLFLMGDTPESAGLESAKAFAEPAGEENLDFKKAFVRYVLLNRNVWVVGLIDLCVYVVRYGTLDWASKFLREYKHYDASAAGYRASLMPMAGVLGVLLSGFIADVVFKSRYRIVNAISLAALAVCIWGLLAVGNGHPYLDIAFLIGIGFFVEGPQSILGGVGAVDAGGSARVASSAAGLIGILAYFGASLSGVGTGWLVDHRGWSGAVYFWAGCAVVGLALCLFAWKEPKAGSAK